jgi:hypothetical protein
LPYMKHYWCETTINKTIVISQVILMDKSIVTWTNHSLSEEMNRQQK